MVRPGVKDAEVLLKEVEMATLFPSPDRRTVAIRWSEKFGAALDRGALRPASNVARCDGDPAGVPEPLDLAGVGAGPDHEAVAVGCRPPAWPPARRSCGRW